MFKRHSPAGFFMILYFIWWTYFLLKGCVINISDHQLEALGKITLAIVILYTGFILYKLITEKGQARADFAKMFFIIYLPIILLILAFLIYLACGGRIITRLW